MNLPNKITLSRIILAIIILFILLFPFDTVGITFPSLFINESIVVDIKYIIVGILFIIALITDNIDGKIARKLNMETNIGKIMDDIADKVLVDTLLIVLATSGFVSTIIAVIVVAMDIIIYSLKLGTENQQINMKNLNNIRNIFIDVGLVLTLFYNLPFELINFRVADVLLMIGTVISIVITIQTYEQTKKYINKGI